MCLHTSYQPSIRWTETQADLLNRILGRYELTTDFVEQSQLQSFALNWSPEPRFERSNTVPPDSNSDSFVLRGHHFNVWLTECAKLPEVQELLQGSDWSALDRCMQRIVLELVLEPFLGLLNLTNSEFMLDDDANSSVNLSTDWKLGIELIWRNNTSSSCILLLAESQLGWLADQLTRLKQRQCDVFVRRFANWQLTITADVVLGTTELSLSQIETLGLGDQILFAPVTALPDSPSSALEADTESADALTCRLVIRDTGMTALAKVQGSAISARACLELDGQLIVSMDPEHPVLPLDVVIGTVNLNADELLDLHHRPMTAFQRLDGGQCLLKYNTKTIAKGQTTQLQSRRAMTVSGLPTSDLFAVGR